MQERPSPEAERPPRRPRQACIFPNTSARHPPRSAHPLPARHPSASNCTDRSSPRPVAASKRRDSTRAAHFACKERKNRCSPALPTSKSRASADLRSWRAQIRACTAADPNLHCEKLTLRHALPHAATQSRTCAHVPHAAAPWATEPAALDKILRWTRAAAIAPPSAVWDSLPVSPA